MIYSYKNQTRQIQIIRISQGLDGYIERSVFPYQFYEFDALPNSKIEVNTYTIVTSILTDRIPCQQLTYSQHP